MAKRSVVKGVAYVGAVVPEELAAKVELLALRTHRSVSDVIRLLIASAAVAEAPDIQVTSLVGAPDGPSVQTLGWCGFQGILRDMSGRGTGEWPGTQQRALPGWQTKEGST
jgi:hypothetical protein